VRYPLAPVVCCGASYLAIPGHGHCKACSQRPAAVGVALPYDVDITPLRGVVQLRKAWPL
jgi:hypothetical protein